MGETAETEPTDGAEAILVDFSDGLKALMAVPVWFLSTWHVGDFAYDMDTVSDIAETHGRNSDSIG